MHPEIAAPSPASARSGKYLTFSLGQESFGVHILKVREIIRVPAITPVPQMPSCVSGVINLRGKVIPVIDLRIKFAFPKAEFHERTCMIVVCLALPSTPNTFLGLIVDVVDEVIAIQPADIEPPPHFGAEIATDYILGIAKLKQSVITILDIDRVVATDVARTAPEKTALSPTALP